VSGIDLLRQQSRASGSIPFVQKRTSPIVATLLSLICPGLGAAYNGQTVKALVYFGIFIGLFQMALLTGTPLFLFGMMGMWGFAGLDAFRTAQMIRSGLTPDIADDVLVRRFSGNPKLWGGVLLALGFAFVLQNVFPFRGLLRGLLPLMLIGLGIYLLKGYIFKPKTSETKWNNAASSTSFALSNPRYNEQGYDVGQGNFADRSRSGSWRDAS
jgi:TM2 domain-containing membrane protein YozV